MLQGRRGAASDDDNNEARAVVRAFLDAASTGDEERVDAYIRAGGDVNATLGEGWTALHGAVTRGQVRVLERLIQEPSCDLNAVTAVGTSALAMALKVGNNITTRMLLDGGASRATIAQNELRRAWDSVWPDVQRRLHPRRSILWTPATHHRFSHQEQAKCWLLICMNHAAAVVRLNHGAARQDASHGGEMASVSTLARMMVTFLMPWRLEQLHAPRRLHSKWVYLPPAVLQLVLQFALFLW